MATASSLPEAVTREDALLAACRAKAQLYTAREVAFLRDVAAARFPLSPSQAKWLQALAEREPVDFERLNARALGVLVALCQRWLPDGRLLGREWVARNPTRQDGSPGSFRINTASGKWADFADPAARGGDPVSLAAYLFHAGNQYAAARDVKRMLGG